MKKCPYCAEEIQDEAIVCRWCGRELINNVETIASHRIQSDQASKEIDISKIIISLIDAFSPSIEGLSEQQDIEIGKNIRKAIFPMVNKWHERFLPFLKKAKVIRNKSEVKEFDNCFITSTLDPCYLIFFVGVILGNNKINSKYVPMCCALTIMPSLTKLASILEPIVTQGKMRDEEIRSIYRMFSDEGPVIVNFVLNLGFLQSNEFTFLPVSNSLENILRIAFEQKDFLEEKYPTLATFASNIRVPK